MSFATITLTSWSQLREYAKPLWMYRGQRSAEWGLKTSLERCCDRENIPTSKRSKIESRLLREFKRAYHQYARHVPGASTALEWLSLMQHHGAPTRLLDFTYSIYVAAYFALEEANADCAIWAIDGRWALKESIGLLHNAGKKDTDKLWLRFDSEKDEEVFGPLFLAEPYVPSATPLNPFRLNERLRIQKGVFLVPGTAEDSFEANLQALPGYDETTHVLRIVIPSNLRREALRELFYMNISRTSLFPGLDGYTQSLGIYHPAFEPDEWA